MKKIDFFILFLLASTSLTYAKTFHVSVTGSDDNVGSKDMPFLTIFKAAGLALADDTVMIHRGTYREWVSPINGGLNNKNRIVYMSAPGEKVYIKGSDVIQGWKKYKGDVWKVEIENSRFGDFNPYERKIQGDWLTKGHDYHLGEVYIDGERLVEVLAKEKLNEKEMTWFVETDDEQTVIYANFSGRNPNKELTEINVRPACFFPKTTGVNYITVSALNISQASPQWAPPTAEQQGIIGPNWSKGWIIENCEISYSKCSGISLGKEYASGHNMWSQYVKREGYTKHGFHREIEAILRAYDLGWNKENIGSHLIKNNTIHHCGQAGIVGHLGGVFSVIENNHIYNINQYDVPKGLETAGIKLHAAIDVIIRDNFIHDTERGIWLDWQAQGAQVSNNLITDSKAQDLFLEVNHGPTLVYNNVFLSKESFLINSQGVACFNNLFKGHVKLRTSEIRYTPYHVAHSTKVRGFFSNNGGDLRFFNNIFLKNNSNEKGMSIYNEYPTYEESLGKKLKNTKEFLSYKFPVSISGNVYLNKGYSFRAEKEAVEVDNENWQFEMIPDGGRVDFEFKVNDDILRKVKTKAVSTSTLRQAMIPEVIYENPDGSGFILDRDFLGNPRMVEKPLPGPFEKQFSGNKIYGVK